MLKYKNNSVNLFNNPPGNKMIAVVLPDGTRVWLNAGSTLRYPDKFDDTERVVTLTGEAYFEVIRKINKVTRKRVPFLINVAYGAQVIVLGTQFNINAYNEDEIKTTLVEGCLQIVPANDLFLKKSIFIIFGEQSVQMRDGRIKVDSNVNLDAVLAWRENYFYFTGDNIQDIMQQLAAWYDVEVVYRNKISGTFFAKVPRDEELLFVLETLSLSGLVKFEVNNNKVIVAKPDKIKNEKD